MSTHTPHEIEQAIRRAETEGDGHAAAWLADQLVRARRAIAGERVQGRQLHHAMPESVRRFLSTPGAPEAAAAAVALAGLGG